MIDISKMHPGQVLIMYKKNSWYNFCAMLVLVNRSTYMKVKVYDVSSRYPTQDSLRQSDGKIVELVGKKQMEDFVRDEYRGPYKTIRTNLHEEIYPHLDKV